MAWRRPGDKPLSEVMMVSLLTHICVDRPQWVKPDSANQGVNDNFVHRCETLMMGTYCCATHKYIFMGELCIFRSGFLTLEELEYIFCLHPDLKTCHHSMKHTSGGQQLHKWKSLLVHNLHTRCNTGPTSDAICCCYIHVYIYVHNGLEQACSTSLLMHWRYCSLALNHWYVNLNRFGHQWLR